MPTGEPSVSRERRPWTAGAILWTVVLGIMSGFQLWRGAWVDGTLFTLLTILLIVDTATHRRIRFVKRPIVAPRWVTLTVVVAIGIVLIVAPRHGLIDLVAMIIIGITAILLAWSPASVRPERPRRAYVTSSIIWSILGVALCLWEALMFVLSTFLPGGTEVYPTVSVLLDPFLDWWPGKIIFIGLWLFVGLTLLRVWTKRPGGVRS